MTTRIRVLLGLALLVAIALVGSTIAGARSGQQSKAKPQHAGAMALRKKTSTPATSAVVVNPHALVGDGRTATADDQSETADELSDAGDEPEGNNADSVEPQNEDHATPSTKADDDQGEQDDAQGDEDDQGEEEHSQVEEDHPREQQEAVDEDDTGDHMDQADESHGGGQSDDHGEGD